MLTYLLHTLTTWPVPPPLPHYIPKPGIHPHNIIFGWRHLFVIG